SDDYMPLGIHVLTTAIVDPSQILRRLSSLEGVGTKANGRPDKAGKSCDSCELGQNELAGFVGTPGHLVDFTDFKPFKDKSIARRLIYHVDATDRLVARVTSLGEFNSQDESAFAVPEPTSKEKQIHVV